MKARTANLICLLVAVIWGGGFLFTDMALDTFSSWTLLAIRFGGAALLVWLPLLFQKQRPTRSAWKKGFLSGIFLYLAFAFQTFGLALTETGMNAFLTAVNVVLVPYLAWIFLHQKPSASVLVASLLCLAGIGCLSLSAGSFSFRFGDVLSLLCAFFFAAQIVSLDGVQNENVLCVNAIQLTTAALLAIGPALLWGGWPAVVSAKAWISCFYSIFFATFACYWLQTLAQKYTSPSAASLLLCTESLWANLFGFLFFHEAKSWIMLAGGALIFLSIFLVEGSSFTKSASAKTASSS